MTADEKRFLIVTLRTERAVAQAARVRRAERVRTEIARIEAAADAWEKARHG